jgi:hypothetical protein
MTGPSTKQLVYADLAKTQLRQLLSTLRRLTAAQQEAIIAQFPREPFAGAKVPREPLSRPRYTSKANPGKRKTSGDTAGGKPVHLTATRRKRRKR